MIELESFCAVIPAASVMNETPLHQVSDASPRPAAVSRRQQLSLHL